MKIDLARVHALAETARARMGGQQQDERRAGRSWYRIENAAGAGGAAAEVYIYDEIGYWGITAQMFVDELRQIGAKAVDLRVNSPGGEVFDGLAIFEAIARHSAEFTAHVDGIAASSASFIVQAADRIVMGPRSRMMIHDAHGIAVGNARDLREMATLLDELSDTVADIYAERAGGTRQQWRQAMQAAEGGPDGTWYDAAAAVRAGLADEVRGADGSDGDPAPTDRLAPTRFNRADPPIGEWTWGEPAAAAFLGMIDEIEHPAPKVDIPDGQALLEKLRFA